MTAPSRRIRSSPKSFFARALLQVGEPPPRAEDERGCPRCGRPPQAGLLREEGHGTSLSLVCSLCFVEWPWPRGRCPACDEADERKLAVDQAAEMEHAQVRACMSCRRYFLVIRRDVEPDAIAEVDEIAALALDVWARERGFAKIQPNLGGI